MPAQAFDRRLAWFVLLQFLGLPPLGYALGVATGMPGLWNLLTPVWVFVVFPLIDTRIGLDTRNPPLERNAGGVLLALVAYGGFKVEHVFGHHVDVATPRDTSTARLGQSAYAFLLRAMVVNPLRAWELAGERLRARGLPAWHWRNEMYLWHGLTLLFAAGISVWLGIAGLVFFVMQALVAITLLELVNYIEHYGLLRDQRPDGSYERVTPRHSWNDSHRLSNLVLLNLQRHSDHHAHAARRYQILRHHDDAPQLPTGYASLVLLALVPPLWRRLMDPRVAAWKAAAAA